MNDIIEKRANSQSLMKENKRLDEDNEDLRQSALDGVDIAQSVQDLMGEREKLSVDLADKAFTIKKLLEQNNNLSMRVAQSQTELQCMYKNTQGKLNQMMVNAPQNQMY